MKEDKKINHNDEVDLISLFNYLINGIKSLAFSLFNVTIKALVIIRAFLISNVYFLIGFLVVGCICGFFYSKLKPPVYETSLTIKSEFLRGFDFLYEIEKLNDYVVEKNYGVVSELFETAPRNVEVLKGFSAYSYFNYHNIFERYGEIEKLDSLSVASEMNSTLFVVTIKMNSDSIVLENVENWLVNFFDKNELLTRNYEIRKANLAQMKDQLIKDVDKLDSLKVGINNSVFFKADQEVTRLDISIKESDNLLENTVNVYDKGWEAFNKLQDVEKQKSLIEKITIVNGIKLIKENQKVFIAGNIINGGFLGIIMFVIIYLLIVFNRFLINYDNFNKKN